MVRATTEAVRVLQRSDAVADDYGLLGAVESLSDLARAGAMLSQHRMQLGAASYIVERGVIAVACAYPSPANDGLRLLQQLSPIR